MHEKGKEIKQTCTELSRMTLKTEPLDLQNHLLIEAFVMKDIDVGVCAGK